MNTYEFIRLCKRNNGLYTTNNYFHEYNPTRSCNELRVPKHRLILCKNGVSFASIKYFNQPPSEMREERSYSRFSLRLKEYNFI